MLAGALSVAAAEVRDLTRRPTWRVGIVALAAWIAVLPRLANPAAGVRDNAAQSLALAGTTAFLLAALVAGLTALRAVQRDEGAGFTLEEASSPVEVQASLAGRVAGCASAALMLVVAGAALGAPFWLGVGRPPTPDVGELLAQALLALPLAAVLGAAVGAACGALFPRDLGAVVTVAVLVGARLAASAVHDRAPWAAWFLPDPGRLDSMREIAFGRAVGVGAIALQGAAALLQSLGAGVLAAAALRHRRA